MNDEEVRVELPEENVLSIHPMTRGMGWVLAASPLDLIDWGVARGKGDRNEMCLRKVQEIVRSFAVDVIVMRTEPERDQKRSQRVRRLIVAIGDFARDYGIDFRLFSKEEISEKFEKYGARNREDIAATLAENIDALGSRLPPRRELWKSEDARLGLFDAAALMVTYFMDRDLNDDPFASRVA